MRRVGLTPRLSPAQSKAACTNMDPRSALGNTARYMVSLLPWSSMLAVSGAISFMLLQALGQGSPEPPLRPAVAVQTSMLPVFASATDGLRWVTIAASQVGRSERCLTASNALSADIIEVYPDEIDRLLADLCTATGPMPSPSP
jgi:hypothetical protein